MHQLSPRLLYRSEICTLRRKDEKLLASSEIKFFRRTTGTPFLTTKGIKKIGWVEKITSWSETKKLQIKLATACNKNEQQHVAKVMLNCTPNGRSQLGRPLKRLLDETKTGLSRPNWWQMMMMMIVILTLCTPSLRRKKKNSTAHS